MRSWNLLHTTLIRLPHRRDNLKSSTIQNPCQLIFNLYIDAFWVIKWFRTLLIITLLGTGSWTIYGSLILDLQDVGGPTVYFGLVSLFKIYIFSRVWSVGTYPRNDLKFLESDSHVFRSKFLCHEIQPNSLEQKSYKNLDIQAYYEFSEKNARNKFLIMKMKIWALTLDSKYFWRTWVWKGPKRVY